MHKMKTFDELITELEKEKNEIELLSNILTIELKRCDPKQDTIELFPILLNEKFKKLKKIIIFLRHYNSKEDYSKNCTTNILKIETNDNTYVASLTLSECNGVIRHPQKWFKRLLWRIKCYQEPFIEIPFRIATEIK